MTTLSNLSEQEVDDYVAHFRATVSTLSSALALFHFRATNGATPLERNAAAAAAIETRRDMDLAEMQFAATTRNNGVMRAPTPAEVQQAFQRATELAQVNALDAQVKAFLKIADEATAAFTQLHPGGLSAINNASASRALDALAQAATLLQE